MDMQMWIIFGGFKEYGCHLEVQLIVFFFKRCLVVVRLTNGVDTSGIPDNRPARSNRRHRVSHQL